MASMVNQAHVEAIWSAAYLENYLECMDSLPFELQRILSEMREVNSAIEEALKELEAFGDSDEPLALAIPKESRHSGASSSSKEGRTHHSSPSKEGRTHHSSPSKEGRTHHSGSSPSKKDQMSISRLRRILETLADAANSKRDLSNQAVEAIELKNNQLEQDKDSLDPANHFNAEPTRHSSTSQPTPAQPSSSTTSATGGSKRGPATNSTTSTTDTPTTGTAAVAPKETTKSGTRGNGTRSSVGGSTGAKVGGGGAKKRKSRLEPVAGDSGPTPAKKVALQEPSTPVAVSSNSSTGSGSKSAVAASASASSSKQASAKKKKAQTPTAAQKRATAAAEKEAKAAAAAATATKADNQSSDDSGGDGAEENEPVYCTCQQISFGEMVGCDNDECDLEWFHFACVKLTSKPKGKWYCPNCRGDRPNVKKGDKKESKK